MDKTQLEFVMSEMLNSSKQLQKFIANEWWMALYNESIGGRANEDSAGSRIRLVADSLWDIAEMLSDPNDIYCVL